MAKKKQTPRQRRMWLIDPIYKKFTAKAFKNLTSPEFYEFFQAMLANGEHTFQFSNKKLDMQVDKTWVEIIEETMPAFYEIFANPRVIITQEELITNVVQARKIDSQVIRHLCAHSYLVDSFDDETKEVTPNKVLNIFKEETWNTYENRFVYSLFLKTYAFVAKRYRDMQEYMSDEFGATLKIDSTALSNMEHMQIKSEMKINQIDDFFDTDDKQGNIFARIKKLYEELTQLSVHKFCKEMKHFSLVYPPLVPTNAIKKNPHLRKCHKLWNFLLAYMDVGYTVNIIEQNPEINEKFEQDIFDNIMFTYIILKGYLEDNRDRALDRKARGRRTTIRPKYIKEIVEEFVRNFDLPDVEVRKILIEELTKEQLLREERDERFRLVEEQRKDLERKRREAEKERAKKLKEQEKAAAKKARDKEKARIKKEKEKALAEAAKAKEKERKEKADAKLLEQMNKELSLSFESIDKRREELGKKREAEVKKTQAAEEKAAAKAKAAEEKKAKAEAEKTEKAASEKPKTEKKTTTKKPAEKKPASEKKAPAKKAAPKKKTAPKEKVEKKDLEKTLDKIIETETRVVEPVAAPAPASAPAKEIDFDFDKAFDFDIEPVKFETPEIKFEPVSVPDVQPDIKFDEPKIEPVKIDSGFDFDHAFDDIENGMKMDFNFDFDFDKNSEK